MTVPSAANPSPMAQRPRPRAGADGSWLIAGGYLAGALLLTARLWVDPAGRMPAGNEQDVNLFAWCLHYSAVAIAHGHLPALVTTAIGAPHGVSLMWNTSLLLPGILLSPVTLLAGPQVSLTIVLTLGIAGSAASLFWVLRQWGASQAGAALGGAVYGFSPAMVNSGLGHNFVLAVLPPLIIDAVLRIVTGRGRPARAGAWLGLLAAGQIFTGEELLVDTAVTALILVAVIALSHPREILGRLRDTALGLATAAAVALAISGYALWAQFLGPLHEHSVLTGSWTGNLGLFVDPSASLLFHTTSSAASVASYNLGLPEALAYLGWPLIITLLVAGIWYWRDPKVRAAAITCAMVELSSLGGGKLPIHGFRLSGSFLPYHWLQGLPAMAQVIPNRLCIVGTGAAGAVLAFALDRARSAALRDRPWSKAVPAAVVALAVAPLIPLPYHSTPVPPVPAGWQTAFTRLTLPASARVLIIPVTLINHTEVMRWQTDTGQPGSMVGGYSLRPGTNGQATFSIGPTQYAAQYLNKLYAQQIHSDHFGLVESALAYWRPAAIVGLTRENSPLGEFLIDLLGPPSFQVDRLLVWRHPRVGPRFKTTAAPESPGNRAAAAIRVRCVNRAREHSTAKAGDQCRCRRIPRRWISDCGRRGGERLFRRDEDVVTQRGSGAWHVFHLSWRLVAEQAGTTSAIMPPGR